MQVLRWEDEYAYIPYGDMARGMYGVEADDSSSSGRAHSGANVQLAHQASHEQDRERSRRGDLAAFELFASLDAFFEESHDSADSSFDAQFLALTGKHARPAARSWGGAEVVGGLLEQQLTMPRRLGPVRHRLPAQLGP